MMIKVTKLTGEQFYVNPFEIEFIEETPDTVLSLKSGKKVLVKEEAGQVIDEMVAFFRRAVTVVRPLREQRGRDNAAPGDDRDPFV